VIRVIYLSAYVNIISELCGASNSVLLIYRIYTYRLQLDNLLSEYISELWHHKLSLANLLHLPIQNFSTTLYSHSTSDVKVVWHNNLSLANLLHLDIRTSVRHFTLTGHVISELCGTTNSVLLIYAFRHTDISKTLYPHSTCDIRVVCHNKLTLANLLHLDIWTSVRHFTLTVHVISELCGTTISVLLTECICTYRLQLDTLLSQYMYIRVVWYNNLSLVTFNLFAHMDFS